MPKSAHRIRVSGRQLNDALARARQFEKTDPRVIKAWYEAKEDRISLNFADGVRVSIPRKQLQGLEHASQSQLSDIEILGRGTGLRWPVLDVDHYVLGLLEHTFGTRRWIREIGRAGGLAKSNAKAEAARKNGLKGGRPRLVSTQNSTR